MNCTYIRENIMDILAAKSGQAAPEVLAHLRQCNVCTQEVDSMRKTMALLDEWEVPEPSPYFLTRLRAHVKEEQTKAPARSLFGWLRRPVMAGSLAAVLLVGGLSYRYIPQILNSHEQETGAAQDMESLDKNADLLVNTDLIDEMTGAPSDDVAEN